MKKEKGFTLVEVIIALALVGIIAVSFLMALSAASKALIVADEHTAAESLARSQMEHIKNQDYSTINVDWVYTVTDLERSSSDWPDWWGTGDPGNPPLLSSNYAGYSVEASADEDDDNPGIQKITVTVSYGSNEIITLEDYKVDRTKP